MEQTHQEIQKQNFPVIVPDAEASNDELIALSPMDMPVEVFTEALNRREANRRALLQWIKTSLVEGVDYGSIHIMGKNKCRHAQQGNAKGCPIKSHWSKNSLFKPGAEKILGMMSLTARYPNIHLYEKAVIQGQEIKVIILKCQLHTTNGMIIGEGTGARTVAQDYGDINKSFKMASKSAMIDASLRVAGLSQIFSQDLEDMFPEKNNGNGKEQKKEQTEVSSSQPEKSKTPADGADINRRITGELYRRVISLAKDKGMTVAELRTKSIQTFGVATDYLRVSEAQSLIQELNTL